ncbi:putative E3 ubiquitin-protein ligase HERC3 [Diretmus argenteus]
MFSWGQDADPGFGSRATDATRTESDVHFVRPRVHITSLSAGRNVVAFVRSDGKVFVCRTHETQDGRRARGKLKNVSCKGRMRDVSCGDDVVILLSEDGSALCLDTAYTPRSLPIFHNKHVSQVACGDQHSVALTKDGQVYTWGQDSSGQLGLGKGKHSTESPQQLKSLSAIPLVQISAGGDHSFALSLSGFVFGWGQNNRGQLGLGDTADRHTPTPVHCLDAKHTGSISCGKDHTAVLTKGGTVFTFGGGQYGQLGHNSFSDELRPRPVELCGAKVTKIACGRHHTLVLTDSKKVYSFGCGEQGQLGHGDRNPQSVPLPIQLSDGNYISEESNSHSMNNEPEQSLENVFDKWISECNSNKSWKKTQNNDKHFQTSPKYSGLKPSLARAAFKTLSKSNQVLTEVEAVVVNLLLPSLDERPSGVEGLRVYLVLTELLHVIQKHTQRPSSQLAEALAAAILRLPSDCLQVLGDWWSSLKRLTMIQYVEVWKQALAQSVINIPLTESYTIRVKHLLQVLQLLYNVYLDEESRVTDVYKKDFFLHLFDELMSTESGMFMYNDSKTLAWFPPEATLEENRYFLFGVLCGLALHNESIIHLPFPVTLFKKLLNVEPSLEDMVEFSPNVGKSLRYILDDYVDDDLENLDMYFSVVWDGITSELDPQNPGKPVTSQNKKEFVDDYVDHAFNTSVENVFREFRRGFFKVCDQDVVTHLFRPEELMGLMVGKELNDWGKLKQNTIYIMPYHGSHPNILTFWEVFEELTEDQKKDFLLFVTGFERAPILGMDQIQVEVEVLLDSTEQHFPEALTCYSLLRLPLYSAKETMQARLTEALKHKRGFMK